MEPPILESISESNGINCLTDKDTKIYSVGISTGGVAEIKMVMNHKDRHVIASTIDPEGAEYAKLRIKKLGLADQIDVRVEDVSEPLPYPNDHFDYIYARLILHYLPRQALDLALAELYRVLRVGGRLFVVVRSTDCPEVRHPTAKFDEASCLTTYSSGGKSHSRYFHSQESIQHHLLTAKFSIKHILAYQEQLCVDFQRTKPASQIDSLIEVLAVK